MRMYGMATKIPQKIKEYQGFQRHQRSRAIPKTAKFLGSARTRLTVIDCTRSYHVDERRSAIQAKRLPPVPAVKQKKGGEMQESLFVPVNHRGCLWAQRREPPLLFRPRPIPLALARAHTNPAHRWSRTWSPSTSQSPRTETPPMLRCRCAEKEGNTSHKCTSVVF